MLLFALISAEGASATPVSATVSPEAPDSTDTLTLESVLRWNTAGFHQTGVTVSWLGPGSLEIEVAVSSPGPAEMVLTVITATTFETVLGVLPAGDYAFSIREIHTQRTTGLVSSGGVLSGGFTVVPEPGTALLLGLGLAGMARVRRR